MKNILALFILFAGLSSCEKETLRGSGSIVKETRQIALFDNIHLNGSGKVTINYAPNQKVEVEGYGNLVTAYDAYVSNGTLILEFPNKYVNIRNNNIHVQISTPNLNGLSINGSGKGVMNAGFPVINDLSLIINGSGDMETGIFPVNNLLVKINGSGNATVKAISKDAEAIITGSGNIVVHATSKLLAGISGSGSIEYYGNPVAVQTQISGSGKITKK